ncbi:MAG: trigger factor [Firmicutes bacterium]|nr:trigger factor [Bacillota bacterium]
MKEEMFKVVVGQYKGLVAERESAEVTEAELEQTCKAQARRFKQNIEVTDRPVQNGDVATIDYEGFIDGVAFAGGKGEGFPLEIGSGMFIPGFEEQLVGAEVGQTVDVNLSFPADYHASDLAGKPALFVVKVNKIEEVHVPELDKSVVADIKAQLVEQKKQKVEELFENTLVKQIIETSEVQMEEDHLAQEAMLMVEEWKAMVRQQGMDPDQYLKQMGMDEMLLATQMINQAELRLKSRLVLEAIAQQEGFEATEADVNDELDKMAIMYQISPEDIKAKLQSEHFKALEADIRMRKSIELIKKHVVSPSAK